MEEDLRNNESDFPILCRDYKVYYINGSGSQETDIESNLRYISNVIFKESTRSKRVVNLYNSNKDFRAMPRDTLDTVTEILLNMVGVDSDSCEGIRTVFIGHSFAATILRQGLSQEVLENKIRMKYGPEISQTAVNDFIKKIRTRVAIFSLGGTKWIQKYDAKIAINYRREGDVIMDFYKMVIPDKVPHNNYNVVGKRRHSNPVVIATKAVYQMSTGRFQGHYLKTYLENSDWQNHLMETLQIDDNHKSDFNCKCSKK